jgi:hypothetical protein
VNIGDKVIYRLSGVDRRYLNKRRSAEQAEYVEGVTMEAVVVADFGNGVLDLYVPELRSLPLKHNSVTRGSGVGQWEPVQ